jgi:ABC-type uncharacterized transport system substrate-binding protein
MSSDPFKTSVTEFYNRIALEKQQERVQCEQVAKQLNKMILDPQSDLHRQIQDGLKKDAKSFTVKPPESIMTNLLHCSYYGYMVDDPLPSSLKKIVNANITSIDVNVATATRDLEHFYPINELTIEMKGPM